MSHPAAPPEPVAVPPFSEASTDAPRDESQGLFRSLEGRPVAAPLQALAAAVPGSLTLLRGTLTGFDADGSPLVALAQVFPGQVLRAAATVDLPAEAAGAQVLVAVDLHDAASAVVTGLLRTVRPAAAPVPATVSIDGRQVTVVAQDELVLRCGSASLTLTAAGKVIIQGRYVLSRSTGPNKIKGAVIDIN